MINITPARLWELNLVISISEVKDLALVKRNASISKLLRNCGALQFPEITFYLTQWVIKT